MKSKNIYFSASNRLKGRYKIFCLTPSISICRDEQCKDFGFTGWQLYFEWLWFQVSLEVVFEKKITVK